LRKEEATCRTDIVDPQLKHSIRDDEHIVLAIG
jgi:hypothetical protein